MPPILFVVVAATLGGCSNHNAASPAATPVATTAPPAAAPNPPSGLALVAGSAGGSGNLDGTGPAARFYFPLGTASDSVGDLYVADAGNAAIRKVTAAGVVSTFAGKAGVFGATDGSLSDARFAAVGAVVLDAAGNLFVLDTGNNTVRKISGGVVTTFAGTAGVIGAADGSGAAASFNNPSGLCIDAAGNLYVTDSGNFTVRKITPAGVVTTIAGVAHQSGHTDGSGAAVRLGAVYGITVDGAGTLYVTEPDSQDIRRITAAGVVSTLAGGVDQPGFFDGTGAGALFHNPAGIVIDGAGVLYVVDSQNEAVRSVTSAGVVATVAGMPGVIGAADGTGPAARFNDPFGISLDAGGNLYVSDGYNHTIRKIVAGGVVTTLAGAAGVAGADDGPEASASFYQPRGITGDSSGNVYIAETGNETIRKIAASGVVSTLAGKAGTPGSADGDNAAARFGDPTNLSIDNAGNLYVADASNNAIRKVTPSGSVSTFAGVSGAKFASVDGTGSAARFFSPQGIATDPLGNLLVADAGNSTIRRITTGAVVTTLAGVAEFEGTADGTGPAASFTDPTATCSDTAGNAYVTDTQSNLIRKVTPAGVVTTVAGSAYVAGSADGTGAAATFDGPGAIACDGAGNLYVADFNNHTIRKVTAGGVVTTVVGSAGRAGVALGALPGSLGNLGGVGVVGTRLYILSDNGVLSTALP